MRIKTCWKLLRLFSLIPQENPSTLIDLHQLPIKSPSEYALGKYSLSPPSNHVPTSRDGGSNDLASIPLLKAPQLLYILLNEILKRKGKQSF